MAGTSRWRPRDRRAALGVGLYFLLATGLLEIELENSRKPSEVENSRKPYYYDSTAFLAGLSDAFDLPPGIRTKRSNASFGTGPSRYPRPPDRAGTATATLTQPQERRRRRTDGGDVLAPGQSPARPESGGA